MKKEILILLAFLYIFIIISGVLSEELRTAIQENIENSVIENNISEIQVGEEVKVFLTFQEKQERRLFKTTTQSKEEVKQEIIEQIGEENVKHDFGDTISVQLSEEQLRTLEENKGVENIGPIGIKQLFLTDSIAIINATLTWPLIANSVNLTGKGQTICIIDSGVNYSHSSLGGCFGNNNASSPCKVIGGWDYCADDTDCTTEDSNPMDVNGHGTHVSGIAAANGTVMGIAPEAKIIMIKAGNSAGKLWDDDIRAGIDWCVNNASLFNISVISMSFGGTAYTDYCDYQDDPMNITLAINNAVAKNISVVVATGNDGYYNAISSPACIRNATPVGSSTKLDVISSFSNTNSIVQLLAPGSSINSTSITGATETKSGTSMATPHVAGAIVIINQYLSLTSRTRTTSEIESILNSTGKSIVDVGYSNLIFSRINIYQTILSLDTVFPTYSNNITYGEYKKYSNFTANISLNDNFLVSAAWLESNHSGVMQNYSYVISAVNSALSKSFNINLSRGKTLAYKWWFNDSAGNTNFSFWNYITIQNTEPTNLTMPNQSWLINSNLTLNLSQYFSDIDSDELNFTNTTKPENISIIINQTSKIATLTPDENFNGTRYIQFTANDSFNISYSNNITLTIFIPTITFSSSAFGSRTTNFSNLSSFRDIPVVIEKQEYGLINFSSITLNQSTINIDDNINISFNKIEINSSNLLCFNTTATLTFYNLTWTNPRVLKDGSFCSSCSELSYSSGTFSFSVPGFSIYTTDETPADTTPPSSGGGGGGSAETTKTYEAKPYELISSLGYTQSLSTGDKIKFPLNNENHTLSLTSVTSNKTTLTLQSSLIIVTLLKSEEKKINLTDSNYYELSIKLNNIVNYKANITIKEIHEWINPERLINKSNISNNQTQENAQDKKDSQKNKFNKPSTYIISIAVGLIILVIIIIVILLLKNKQNQNNYRKSKSNKKIKK